MRRRVAQPISARHRGWPVVTALLALVVVASCSAVPSASRVKESSAPGALLSATPSVVLPAPATPAGAVNGAGMPLAPASYYDQKLMWTNCAQAAKAFECATLKVPLDYRSPARSIGLSVLKRPADGTAEGLGALVINPGGPGASGVDYAKYATNVFSAGITARYDVVGFDPRGVGRSAPIRCIDNRQTDTWLSMDDTPDTPAEIARLVWEACGEDPDAFALEHLPSFPVDVQRRWPSVEKAKLLLDWEADIELTDGLAQTVTWLREREQAPS